MQILGESLVGIRRWSVGALVEQNHDVCAPQFIARLAGWGSAACRGDLFANCAQDADAVGAQTPMEQSFQRESPFDFGGNI